MLTFSRPKLDNFLNTYEINLFSVSEDEKRLAISTNLSGAYDIWMLELPLVYPYRITNVGEKVDRLSFDPKNRHLYLSFDDSGNEKPQIFATNLFGAPLKPIIKHKTAKNHLQTISHDGTNLYYASDKDNKTFMNSYRKNIITGEEETILIGEDALTFITSVSRDEQSFTFNKAYSTLFIAGYVKKGNAIFSLVPDPNRQHRVKSPQFIDNDTIYFLTDYEQEYSYVAKYSIGSKEFTPIWKLNGEEVNDIVIDSTHKLLYAFTTKGVKDYLYQINLLDYTYTPIHIPINIIQHKQILPSGNLYISGESEIMPSNIYKYTFQTNKWESITQNRIMGVDMEELTKAITVTYKSFDEMEIEGLLYNPNETIHNGYTIIWCHGGPHSAEKKQYRGLFQYLCNEGFRIFAPNFRGSTGYGSSFAKLAELDWGGGPRKDIVAGIEWLINEGIAEQEKIFLMGKSYGGYLSLLLHGRHSEYFKAVVDMYGESDLIAFLRTVPETWKPLMKKRLGDLNVDKERLIKDSPITYVDRMIKPMLVIHGKNDTRVDIEQSEIIVNAFRKRNRNIEYLVLDDEGHGFSKKENEINVYKNIISFFNKHID